MDGLFGRVFGSCFRTFWWEEDPIKSNKHIDYIPNRKLRYNDQNLMRELNEHSSWDIMDLADDEFANNHFASKGKLELHDNVFLNPLNNNNNAIEHNTVNEKPDKRHEILQTTPTIVELVPAPSKQSPSKFHDGGTMDSEVSDLKEVNRHDVIVHKEETNVVQGEDQEKLITSDQHDDEVQCLHDSVEDHAVVA